ncbi:MAG TPA: cell division protein CrgA [Mycobacteriales bacterium]|nr:cell division protein CrgA [Mycobacteriales bacterium]
MPKSRVRQKAAYTPPPRQSPKKKQSPPWVGALMVISFLIGIAWLALFYVTDGSFVLLRPLHNFNLLIGFLWILGGFGLATRWR